MAILSNPKHEKLAQGRASGLSAFEAYEQAGYTPDHGNASRKAADDGIRQRVKELQEAGAERVEGDRAELLSFYWSCIRNAEERTTDRLKAASQLTDLMRWLEPSNGPDAAAGTWEDMEAMAAASPALVLGLRGLLQRLDTRAPAKPNAGMRPASGLPLKGPHESR